MNKKLLITLISSSLLISSFASAQTVDIASLQKIIDNLRAQIAQLMQNQQQTAAQITNLQTQLQLSRNLGQGSTGDDVKLLQQTLSTDPTLFSGGVTGYFGNLTREAVMKFQERLGLPQTGDIGPQTRAQLNQLYGDLASSTAGIPAGLLRGGFAPMNFPLFPVNMATAKGEASIFPVDASTSRVVVHFATQDDLTMSSTSLTYKTHIHSGSCASTGQILYPLNDIVNNKSETSLLATISDLSKQYPLSIMVHGNDASSSIIACGDLIPPRPIYRKMDINGDGKIDSTDMLQLQNAQRMHDQGEQSLASSTQEHQNEMNIRERNFEQQFNQIRNRLWNGVQGIIPGMMRGGDGQGNRGDNNQQQGQNQPEGQ